MMKKTVEWTQVRMKMLKMMKKKKERKTKKKR